MAEQRLIDANAILYCKAVDGDTFEGTGKLYARKEDIDALPTIEERKTGKWSIQVIRSNWSEWTIYTCSECGEDFKDLEKRNYCPNCGIAMTEGEQP